VCATVDHNHKYISWHESEAKCKILASVCMQRVQSQQVIMNETRDQARGQSLTSRKFGNKIKSTVIRSKQWVLTLHHYKLPCQRVRAATVTVRGRSDSNRRWLTPALKPTDLDRSAITRRHYQQNVHSLTKCNNVLDQRYYIVSKTSKR